MTVISTAYQYLRDVLFLFVKYRIHLSFIFYFVLSYNNLRVSETLNYDLIFSFSLWHFSLFLFDRVYDRKIDREAQPNEFVPDNQAIFLYVLIALMMMGSLWFYWRTAFELKYWLILFPITFLYPLRLYKGKRVKSFFLIKNVYSALFIFCGSLFIQAYLLNGYSIPSDAVLFPIYSLFIYVMIGEIFWDIRDTSVDKKHGTQTLPNTIGIGKTKAILVVLILLDSYLRGWDVSSSAIIYLVLLTFVKEETDRLIFHLPPLIALFRFLT